MDKKIFFCRIRGGTSVLALNSTDTRLIAAGQQSKNKSKKEIDFYFYLNRLSIIFN